MTDTNGNGSPPAGAEIGADETQGITWRGRIRQVWRFIASPHATVALGTLVVVGFVSGIISRGGFNWSMEMTNNQEFCVSCHEIAGGNLPGNIGPPLVAMKARFPSFDDLREQISDPRVKNPNSITY